MTLTIVNSVRVFIGRFRNCTGKIRKYVARYLVSYLHLLRIRCVTGVGSDSVCRIASAISPLYPGATTGSTSGTNQYFMAVQNHQLDLNRYNSTEPGTLLVLVLCDVTNRNPGCLRQGFFFVLLWSLFLIFAGQKSRYLMSFLQCFFFCDRNDECYDSSKAGQQETPVSSEP